MNKIISLILTSIFLSLICFTTITFADTTDDKVNVLLPVGGNAGDFQKKAVDDAAKSFNESFNVGDTDFSDAAKKAAAESAKFSEASEAIKKLPKGGPVQIIAGAVKIILSVAGTLAGVAILVAGVMYVTAQGNEEITKKAKTIIIYTFVALIVMAVSYAIITGIASLQFF